MKYLLTLLLALSVAFVLSDANAASPVFDEVNDGESPGNFVFSPDNVGWIYQPGTSYSLDGISSTFRAVSNPPVTTRNVTLSVYDDVPAAGGNLLRTGMFSAGGGGGNLGIMFAPLDLQAGETYFVGLSGLTGLGLNIVDFAVSLPAPDFKPNPAIDFFDGWYSGANFETFVAHTFDTPAGFAAPILRFHGVPEPSSVLIAGITIVMLAVGKRRFSTRR